MKMLIVLAAGLLGSEASPPIEAATAPKAESPLQLRGPTPFVSPGTWITAQDYPRAALREEAAGTTRFRLDVSADGAVENCTVTVSSGNATLDETTCGLVQQRARFEPARDAQGRPTIGRYSNAVRWLIPSELMVPETSTVVRAFDIKPDGSIDNCAFTEVTGSATRYLKTGATPCPKNVRYEKPTSGFGQPRTRHVSQSTVITVTDTK